MAYRALIVDDEPIIRYGLASTVDWAAAGVELAGEAGNGEAALALVAERSIDILITDIKMPLMDGLELIRLSRQRRPRLKAILISSYSDFEYARQAVQLDAVVDYLLKPTMEPEDVTRLLGVCRRRLDEEEALLLRSALYDRTEAERERSGIGQELLRAIGGQPADLARCAAAYPGPYAVSVWRREGADGESDADEEARRLAALTAGAMEGGAGIALAAGEGELVWLLSGGGDAATAGERAARLVRRAHAAMSGADSGGRERGGYTVGIGPAFHKLERLAEACEWARGAFDQAFFAGTGGCYEGSIGSGEAGARDEEERLRREAAAERSYALRERLSRQLADSDAEACGRTLERLFELWRSRELPPGDVRKQAADAVVRLQSARAYLRTEEQLELLMQDQERLRKARAIEDVIAIVASRYREESDRAEALPLSAAPDEAGAAAAIRKAVAFIREHYRSEITLQEAADSVHMSRNYFSEQFKRWTGLNFIDYVIRLRIRYACYLLETTTLKVLDVGLQSGFNSSKHFLKIFKREVGCTPAEYRARLQAGGGGTR